MAEIDFPGAVAEWQGRIYDVGDAESRIPFRIGLKNLPGHHRSKGPVLLVHGASAASRTFEVSARSSHAGGGGDGLAGFLRNRGWDVWLLDWRSSGVLAPILMDDADRPLKPDRFNLDEAQDDLIEALEQVAHATHVEGRIPVVGHCIGGALVAQTVASEPAHKPSRIGNIVLTTLGLFFNSGLDDWVKGNERFLEEVWWKLNEDNPNGDFFISPWVEDHGFGKRHPWPEQLSRAYDIWKEAPLSHQCNNEFCRRVCFMFGMPYRPTDMMSIHDEAFPGGLWRQFGRMPLVTYMHCVHNLRRGWAAPWQADDSNTKYLVAEPFGRRSVTLITGNENQVWHRDSIDRMYEWLRRELPPTQHRQVRKHVLPRYGHQDLYWSERACEDVYPCIEAGLAA